MLRKFKKSAASFFILFLFNCVANFFGQSGYSRGLDILPEATLVRGNKYTVLGNSSGQSSTFFLFGILPMTDPLNIEYALSEAVQKIPGGQSIVNVSIWHETHYYLPVGKVSVVKVEGDVIKYIASERPPVK